MMKRMIVVLVGTMLAFPALAEAHNWIASKSFLSPCDHPHLTGAAPVLTCLPVDSRRQTGPSCMPRPRCGEAP
jgi:hypothetical protein